MNNIRTQSYTWMLSANSERGAFSVAKLIAATPLVYSRGICMS
jgi:hypothetical protein